MSIGRSPSTHPTSRDLPLTCLPAWGFVFIPDLSTAVWPKRVEIEEKQVAVILLLPTPLTLRQERKNLQDSYGVSHLVQAVLNLGVGKLTVLAAQLIKPIVLYN